MRRATDTSTRDGNEELTARLEALEAMCADLARKNDRLRASVETLTGEASLPAQGNATPSPPTKREGGVTGPVSRRRLLRSAGVAAVGAVAVTALERPDQAAASNGSNVVAGSVTKAESRTSVEYDGSSGYSGVVLLGNDSTYDGGSASYPAGLGGWAGAGATAGSGGVANGVYGYTDNGAGNGVVGINSNAVSGGGNGVLGAAAGANQVGVKGTNSAGTAVEGSSGSTANSATAVYGVITNTSPGSFSSAVRAENKGTGSLGLGVWGSHAGSGWGGYFTSDSGIGVNAAGGTGIGVNATGSTGVQAQGDTLAVFASSFGRGVVASGSVAPLQLTPGGASTHPDSGEPGDIYVDSAARAWFCRGGDTWVELTAAGATGQTEFSAASTDPTLTAANTDSGAGLAATSATGPGLTSTGTRGVVASGSAAQLRLSPGSRATHPASGQPGDVYVDARSRPWFCTGGSKWVLLTPAAAPKTGVGGVFSGKKAAIRLIPSSSRRHPRSGQPGELFVDSSHRLWFCKRGGAKARWKQIA